MRTRAVPAAAVDDVDGEVDVVVDPPAEVVVVVPPAAAVVVVEPLEPLAMCGIVVVVGPVDVGSLYAGAFEEPVAPTVR